MFGLGFGEILIILVVALVFIGPKRLPGLARTLGKGLREFQNATKGIMEQIENPDSGKPNYPNHQDHPGAHTSNEEFHKAQEAAAKADEKAQDDDVIEAEVVMPTDDKSAKTDDITAETDTKKKDEEQQS